MFSHFKEMCSNIERQLRDEKGQGLVEYALILILIAVVAIAIMTQLGSRVTSTFSSVNSSIGQH